MNRFLNIYYRAKKWRGTKALYLYTAKRFNRYCNSKDTEESLIGIMTMAAHGIEKGLTMGNLRPGFGKDRLLHLLDDGEKYVHRYGIDNIQIVHIATIVNDYKICHDKLGYALDAALSAKIDRFLSHFDCPTDSCIQIDCTKETFFSKRDSNFEQFSQSRHSCRYFSDQPVPVEKIDHSIALAQTSPSACNRQPVRLYVIETRATVQKVLSLHGGTRGFTQNIDKLIIVCGYLPCYHSKERDCVYTDCGIFTMNLAYSLHYHQIGACILNWSVEIETDKALRKIIPISDKEAVCTLIACGNVPDSFKVCNSRKKEVNSIIRHIK